MSRPAWFALGMLAGAAVLLGITWLAVAWDAWAAERQR